MYTVQRNERRHCPRSRSALARGAVPLRVFCEVATKAWGYSMTARIVQWGCNYINKLGLALVPIPPGTKGPTTEGWNKPGGYFTREDQAKGYWNHHSDHGIGAVLGASRLVTLDADQPDYANRVLYQFAF
jgi:Bifunctional DNA primase/polymerase, N-terminal